MKDRERGARLRVKRERDGEVKVGLVDRIILTLQEHLIQCEVVRHRGRKPYIVSKGGQREAG